MSFIAFGGEKRIADLVTRIFGKLKAADAKRAAAALLVANPQLERLDLVGRGRPIAVPTIPGLARRREADTSAPLAHGVEELRAALGGFVSQLGERDKLEKRDLEETRALMESDDIRSIIDNNPSAGELLERIAKATDKRGADLDRRSAFIKRLRRTEKELAELTKTLG
jgi:hypothetical protein